jgi:hypothetical protein
MIVPEEWNEEGEPPAGVAGPGDETVVDNSLIPTRYNMNG